jgi:hypothetical protein
MTLSSEVEQSKLTPFTQALLKTFTRVFMILCVAVLNPFHIAEWSGERSNDLWQRIHADGYGQDTLRNSDALAARPLGRDAITIVYFDDESLRTSGDVRPLSASTLSTLVDDIIFAAGSGTPPTGIFVDMMLANAADVRDTQTTLMASLADGALAKRCEAAAPSQAPSPFQCLLTYVARQTRYALWKDKAECQVSTLSKLNCIRAAPGAIPLLFADPRNFDDDGRLAAGNSPSPALDALGAVAATVPVSVFRRAYPLAIPALANQRTGRRYRLYPASALYVLWCEANRAICRSGDGGQYSPVTADIAGRPNLSRDFDHSLSVIWGIGGPQPFDRDTERTATPQYWFARMMLAQRGGAQEDWCAPAQPAFASAVGRLLGLATAGVHRDGLPPCTYTEAVPYSLLQASVSATDMRRLFARRIVMIGGQFADSNDLIPAGPFGELPGVYYHAMALDNLIERGPGYSKNSTPIVAWLDISWGDLRGLIPTAIVTLLLAWGSRILEDLPAAPHDDRRERRRVMMIRARILTGFVAALLAVFLLFTGESGLIPRSVNLVAVTLLCLFGIRDLVWAALKPVRVTLAGRFHWSHLIHLWSASRGTIAKEPAR